MPPRRVIRLVPVLHPRPFPEGLKLAPYPKELPLPQIEPENPSPLPSSPPARRRKISRRKHIYRTPPERRRMRVPRGAKLDSEEELSPEKSEAPAPSQVDLPRSEAVTPYPEPDQPDLEAVTPQSPPQEPGFSDVPPERRRTLPDYFYPPKRVLPQYFCKGDPNGVARAMSDSKAERARRLVKEAAAAVASLDRAEEKENGIEDEEEACWEEDEVPWCR